jgi:cytochrome c oxidase assembly protein subunit 15
MAVPRVSPRAFARLSITVLVLQIAIIGTGVTTRLTDSGLGCPDWPECKPGHFFVVPELSYHAVIELANRAMSGPVVLSVLAVLVAAYLRAPRRRDFVLLGLALVGGTFAQVLLGGVTVLTELRPEVVMGHFLMSMLLLWAATVLHWRAARPDTEPQLLVEREQLVFARVVFAAAAVVVFTGTIVTGTGPHGGDENVERLPFYLPDVARIHGISAVLFVALTITLLLLLRSSHAPHAVQRRGLVLLAILLAQGVKGYVMYLTAVPVILVGLHIAGAVAVWIGTIRLLCSMHERVPPEPALGAQPVTAMTSSAAGTATISSTA